MKKCVLAYSGGLDTSSIIPWLKETYQCQVLAYCCNLGNLPDERTLRDQALQLGADDFKFENCQDEFVNNFIAPMLRAGATYFDDYLLGTAIARPLIAKQVSAYARQKGATMIAHGATGKGNDHLRFEAALAYLVPEIEIIAPWKIWKFKGRSDLIDYLSKKDFHWQKEKGPYSVDSNVFHTSYEGGKLEDIESPYSLESNDFFKLKESTNEKTMTISLRSGIATAIDGVEVTPLACLQKLNEIASEFQIGVCDIVEERINGIKSRGIYQTPGGTLIHLTLKALKQICWSQELYFLSQNLSLQYGELIYKGLWYSDARAAMEAYFETATRMLSGEIAIQLRHRQVDILTRKSPLSLYKKSHASFEQDDDAFNFASKGFSKIYCLSSKLQGERMGVLK